MISQLCNACMGEEPRDLSHHGGELGGRRRDRDGIEIEGLESDVLEQRELFASTGSLSSPTSWGGEFLQVLFLLLNFQIRIFAI